MTSPYYCHSNPSFAAPPAPDYLNPGQIHYQDQGHYQYQQQQSFAPPPHNNSYQHYQPPARPLYTNNDPAVPSQYNYPPQQQQDQVRPTYSAPPPSYTPQNHLASGPHSYAPYQAPPQLQPSHPPIPQQQKYTPQPSPSLVPSPPSRQASTQSYPQVVTYTLAHVRSDRGSLRNKFRQTHIWSLSPDYTLAFIAPSSLSSSQAELSVQRGGKEVGRCNWNKSAGWNHTFFYFPFCGWAEAWDPDSLEWLSDAGTVDGGKLEWATGADDAGNLKFSCLTVGETGDGQPSGVKGEVICRVTVFVKSGGYTADVDLCGEKFAPGRCKVEQLDEMLTVAAVMVARWSNGWMTKTPTTTASGHGGTTAAALELATNTMSLVSEIIQAAGGG